MTPGDTTWAWRLVVHADGMTRIITPVRSRYRWLPPTILFSALLEFADPWMMRKMLLNLRERIEALEPAADACAGRTVATPQSEPAHRANGVAAADVTEAMGEQAMPRRVKVRHE